MENLLSLKKEVIEQARKFQLKGRSKIKTYEELLKAMKEQDFEKERKILMSVNRRRNNLQKRTQSEIDKLPKYPEKPLKGRGHAREWWNNEDFTLFYGISEHTDYVATRHGIGRYTWDGVVSPELETVLVKFSKKRREIEQEFLGIEPVVESKESKVEKPKPPSKQKRQVNNQYSEAERLEREKVLESLQSVEDLFAEFFKKEMHPAPKVVYDAKFQSNLSWNALRAKYAG